jgi:CheY-like chemotaxis protein
MPTSEFPKQAGFKMDDALRRLRGRKDRLLSYLESFSERCSSLVLDLRRHNELENIEEARRLAHQIKGTGANLGAERLAKSAGKIEQHYKSHPAQAPDSLLIEIEQNFLELQTYVAGLHDQDIEISDTEWNASTETESDSSPSNTYRILIIDDSDEDRGMLQSLLEHDYQIETFADAEQGMEALSASEDMPQLLLLDVDMPSTSGYDVCKQIKENPDTANIDVIFLSGLDSTEEILRGLDAGATDYITKPFSPAVLESKIKSSIQLHLKHTQLEDQAKNATQLAQTFMNESTRMSTLVSFFRGCYSVSNAKGLCDAYMGAMAVSGLSTVIYLRSDFLEECASSTGEVLTLEYELLSRLYDFSEPFVEKGSRLFAVQDKVVVLIKNMPEDDEKRGSLKDYIMILLEGINEKIRFLDQQTKQDSQKNKLMAGAIVNAIDTLDNVNEQRQSSMKNSIETLETMIENVESSIFSLGLTEEQEDSIINLLQSKLTESQNQLYECLTLDDKVCDIVVELGRKANRALH